MDVTQQIQELTAHIARQDKHIDALQDDMNAVEAANLTVELHLFSNNKYHLLLKSPMCTYSIKIPKAEALRLRKVFPGILLLSEHP